jgi:sulfite reductase (ferredoxin)
MGMTNSKPETFPHLGREVCYLSPDEVVKASEAVIKLFRDHGNRSDRKRARIKYLMHDWGVEKFREVFHRDYFQQPLVAPKHAPVTAVDLHLGWHSQGGDKWFYGVSVENGRVKDEGSYRLRSGLLAAVTKLRCNSGGPRCRFGRQAQPDSEMEHGLPGDPDLPAGDQRERALPADVGGRTGEGTGRDGPG